MDPSKKVHGEASLAARAFDVLFRIFLGLALLKFGNPARFDVPRPNGFLEWLLSPWPIGCGYLLLGLATVIGLFKAELRFGAPKWVVTLPVAWLLWQCLSASQTVDAQLTGLTLMYFSTCAACFYLGYACLGNSGQPGRFWLPIIIALALVLLAGFAQHFGGLEQSHRYFQQQIYPSLKTAPDPELLKRMSSNRIFSTLFYPNALAGVLLLLLPPATAMFWRPENRVTNGVRIFLTVALWSCGLACLYWSGSKGGWLLELLLVFVALLHLPLHKKYKLILTVFVVVLGLTGFGLKYARFFEKGATSVQARFDYWQAALQTAKAHPLFGSGPGTFGVVYRTIKPPEAEMTQMTHNDYLEQASDSGWPGFIIYVVLIATALCYSYVSPRQAENRLRFCVWLGLLGWALQSVEEFNLYIPALSWPAFASMGWLLGGVTKRFDKARPNRLASKS